MYRLARIGQISQFRVLSKQAQPTNFTIVRRMPQTTIQGGGGLPDRECSVGGNLDTIGL